MTPITAAIPVVISLFEQINTSPSTWYAANWSGHWYFLYTCQSRPPEADCFQLAMSVIHIQFKRYINSLTLCHNLVCKNLDHLPQDITPVHYIDNIMVIGSSKQEIATTLDLLVRHQCIIWGK